MPALSVVFVVLFYAATAMLVGGVGYHIWLYARTPQPLKIPTTPAPTTLPGVALRMFKEVVLFESLFKANKWIWLFGWMFHFALVLVLLRHLRYFTEIGYASPLSFATLNEAQYQALSPELRGAVDKAAGETQETLWKLLETRLSANYTRMGANGMTIARGDAISPELRQLLARSAADAVEAWKKEAGPTAAALVK